MTKWIPLAAMLLMPVTACAAGDSAALLTKIKAVSKEGNGNEEAGKAWQELVKLGPDALLDILTALDDANPAAANWLRAGVDAIAERTLVAGKPLPAAKLEAFVKDTKHVGQGRRLAYEWLVRIDPAAADRLLPGMLNDPGSEMRRDAVARVLKEAKDKLDAGDKTAATATYQKALEPARDRDQVDLIAKQLKELGVTIDLQTRYGFINKWMLAGPFDNTNKSGFDKAYPPEKGVDLKASYDGKKEQIKWIEHTTTDPYAMVDLNKAIGKNMGAVGYAFAVIESKDERPVEIRAGSNNAVKLYLNGKQIFFREEYHHGMRMDQHVGLGTLKAGRNEILVKICQNEQTDSWAQNWSFQLRVCDALGGPVPVKLAMEKPPARKDTPPAKKPEGKMQ